MEKFWQRCGKWVKKKHWLLLHFLVIWITQTFVKAPHMMVIKCSYTDVDYDGKVKRTILRVTAMMIDENNFEVWQDVEKRQKKRLLLDYLSDNLKHHNWSASSSCSCLNLCRKWWTHYIYWIRWAYRYFFCEFLALINVIGKNPHFSASMVFCF